MTTWNCKTCGAVSYDSQGVYAHRVNTGHVGASLVADDCPPPSTSTPQAREAAKRAARDAVLAAKERGGR